MSFANAKPNVKASMVVDGFEHISARICQMRMELNILNDWITKLPTEISAGKCEEPNMHDLLDSLSVMNSNQDELTSEFIRMSQLLETLTTYLKSRRSGKV